MTRIFGLAYSSWVTPLFPLSRCMSSKVWLSINILFNAFTQYLSLYDVIDMLMVMYCYVRLVCVMIRRCHFH